MNNNLKYSKLLELDDSIKEMYSFPLNDFITNAQKAEGDNINDTHAFTVCFIGTMSFHYFIKLYLQGGDAIKLNEFNNRTFMNYWPKRWLVGGIAFSAMLYFNKFNRLSNPYSRGELN